MKVKTVRQLSHARMTWKWCVTSLELLNMKAVIRLQSQPVPTSPTNIVLKRRCAPRMKINPYDNHPENKFQKSQKKFLTNFEISEIIQKEIEEIQSKPTPTWGYTRSRLIEILNKIRDTINVQLERQPSSNDES